MSLTKIVDVIREKCRNCHACITACPSKLCNNGIGDYVEINQNLCIGCGQCIKACTWGARVLVDDTQKFLEDRKQGIEMIAVVAPAIAVNFPYKYLNFNGWLKRIGISAIFDVSFGAELTIKSYLEYIKVNNQKTVIAQPCPAIVNYIELYRPELLEYLAPADSPIVHTIKMVKEFYPEYKFHKVVVISPCIAKKREFEATGFGDYNVTMAKLQEYFKASNITLSVYPQQDYDNPPAERAVLFSTPGGLLETATRWNNNLRSKIRKIESPHSIYHYLNHLHEDIVTKRAPLIVDCLNCELGCNGGTGTNCTDMSIDKLEHIIETRKEEMKQKYLASHEDGERTIIETDKIIQEKIVESINKYWKEGLYNRKYTDRSNSGLEANPPLSEINEIFKRMLKFNADDLKNCSACGYGSCKDMAIAIYNGLNKHDNCHYYQATIIQNRMNMRKDIMNEFDATSQNILARFAPILKSIEEISMLTTILSINASIEATRVGEEGAGFGVVAQNIGDLAKKSKVETGKMEDSLTELKLLFNKTLADFSKEIEDRHLEESEPEYALK